MQADNFAQTLQPVAKPIGILYVSKQALVFCVATVVLTKACATFCKSCIDPPDHCAANTHVQRDIDNEDEVKRESQVMMMFN